MKKFFAVAIIVLFAFSVVPAFAGEGVKTEPQKTQSASQKSVAAPQKTIFQGVYDKVGDACTTTSSRDLKACAGTEAGSAGKTHTRFYRLGQKLSAEVM